MSQDSSSSIEIGTAGTAAAGTITIDSGDSVTEYGYFNAYTIVDAGTLQVGASQSLTVNGIFEDEGGLTIGAGANMSLTGALQLSDNVTVDAGGFFLPILRRDGNRHDHHRRWRATQPRLATQREQRHDRLLGRRRPARPHIPDLNASNAFAPTITGFGAADVIDYYPSSGTITSVSYAAGVLSILDGATVVATLNLTGTYNNTFSVLPISGGYYQIDYHRRRHASRAGGHDAQCDSYTWVGPVAGNWNAVANWDDMTAGQNPAALAPAPTTS